ncbi:intersectin [Acrasis kona]|uniref:Intersectin n=1 Tax=Acrasis kona TaxID=1008807 RepID=A0AAW2YW11_9EUKA
MTVKSGRKHVLNEIIQSEKLYTLFLQALIDVYYQPLKFRQDLISKENVEYLFADYLPIRNVHIKILEDFEVHLEQTRSAGKKIDNTLGEIFLRHAPELKVYVKFCNEFETRTKLLTTLRTQSKDLDLWLNQQISLHQQCKNNSIESLMVMPVQKLPRYNLLIKEILQLTSSYHRDHGDLQKALDVIKETNSLVNLKIKEYNNWKKTESLASVVEESGCSRTEFNLSGDQDRKLVLEHRHVGLKCQVQNIDSTDLDMFLFSDYIVFFKRGSFAPTELHQVGFSFVGLIYVQAEEEQSSNLEENYNLQYVQRIRLASTELPWIKDIDNHSYQVITKANTFTIIHQTEDQKVSSIKSIVQCLDLITKTDPVKYKKHAIMLRDEDINPIQIPKSPRKSSDSPSTPTRTLLDVIIRRKVDDPLSYINFPTINHTHFPPRDLTSPTTMLLDKQELATLKQYKLAPTDQLARAMSTFIDETFEAQPDEITFRKGDLVVIHKGLNQDYCLVGKLGINVDPDYKKLLIKNAVPRDYDSLKKLMKAQRSTRHITPSKETENQKVLRKLENHFIQLDTTHIENEVNEQLNMDISDLQVLLPNTVKEPDVTNRNSWSTFFFRSQNDSVHHQFHHDQESSLFKCVINKYEENGQAGIVPSRFFLQIQNPIVRDNFVKLYEKRELVEERKVRSFTVKKKSLTNSTCSPIKFEN